MHATTTSRSPPSATSGGAAHMYAALPGQWGATLAARRATWSGRPAEPIIPGGFPRTKQTHPIPSVVAWRAARCSIASPLSGPAEQSFLGLSLEEVRQLPPLPPAGRTAATPVASNPLRPRRVARRPSAAHRPCRSRPITAPAAPSLAGHAPSPPSSAPSLAGHAPSPPSSAPSLAGHAPPSAPYSIASRVVPLCLPRREDSGGQAEVMGGHGYVELVQFEPAAIDCGA
nr:transcriptional regulatory protein AlgP-like [Aegilops tauschii subsp. strangulata]